MSVPTTASILIANFNYGRFLPDAIDSALAQTWPDVQVVVVDDGSTDHSRLLIESYGDQVTALFKENGGQASAFEAGLPLLTGDVTILLDADDMLDPTAIEKTIGLFADPNVVKVHWPMAVVDEYGYPSGEIRWEKLPSGNFRDRALEIGPASHDAPACSGNFWRTSFLRAIPPIPPGKLIHVVDSYLFTFSPFFGEFRAWNDPLTFYRIHGDNFSEGMDPHWRCAQWEERAVRLQAWLASQDIAVSIDDWRARNPYYQRLSGIAAALAEIGQRIPPNAGILLIAGRLYDQNAIEPKRPIYRAPLELLESDATMTDFRREIGWARKAGIPYVITQGRAAWNQNQLRQLTTLLRDEHTIVYENDWVVIAKLKSEN